MKATTQNNGTTNQTFTLELSFIEMHIIQKALSCYGYKHGYGAWDTPAASQEHADAAEKLHDEMTEIYTS